MPTQRARGLPPISRLSDSWCSGRTMAAPSIDPSSRTSSTKRSARAACTRWSAAHSICATARVPDQRGPRRRAPARQRSVGLHARCPMRCTRPASCACTPPVGMPGRCTRTGAQRQRRRSSQRLPCLPCRLNQRGDRLPGDGLPGRSGEFGGDGTCGLARFDPCKESLPLAGAVSGTVSNDLGAQAGSCGGELVTDGRSGGCFTGTPAGDRGHHAPVPTEQLGDAADSHAEFAGQVRAWGARFDPRPRVLGACCAHRERHRLHR